MFVSSDIKKQRNIGIDFLRVWAMLAICMGHLLWHGGCVDLFENGSVERLFLCFCSCLINVPCMLNCFALISGYVMVLRCQRQTNAGECKIRFDKLFQIEFQILFFTLSLAILFFLFLPNVVGKSQWLHALFPVLTIHYWYLSAYIPVLMLAPFVLTVLFHFGMHDCRTYLWLAFVFICMLSQIPVLGKYSTWLANDMSVNWLLFCFFIGGFCARFGFRSLLPNACQGALPLIRRYPLGVYLFCCLVYSERSIK